MCIYRTLSSRQKHPLIESGTDIPIQINKTDATNLIKEYVFYLAQQNCYRDRKCNFQQLRKENRKQNIRTPYSVDLHSGKYVVNVSGS